MAILINDNLRISAGKPADSRYLKPTNVAYDNVDEVNSAIPIPQRYLGLTVKIGFDEYWYREDVYDSDLVKKIPEVGIGTITGATNIGFFSGTTAIQRFHINHLENNDYDGNYESLYNYYYRDDDGFIRIGTPSDGIEKRGYLKSDNPIKSWVWNESHINNQKIGWILVDGDIRNLIGKISNVNVYYDNENEVYTNTNWDDGSAYNNGGVVTIDAVRGNLTTGTTLTIGGPFYAREQDNILKFRTLLSKTPNIISVDFDDSFVYVSGVTPTISATNIGDGEDVYFQTTLEGQLEFKRIRGIGNTLVTTSEDERTIEIQADTGVTAHYDGDSPSTITVGGIDDGTELTGKTWVDLFEELLVPAINPTLINPYNSFSLETTINNEDGLLYNDGYDFEHYIIEIGYQDDFELKSTFNRGSIIPLYDENGEIESNDYPRSGLPLYYKYSGHDLPNTELSDGSLINTQIVSGYTVTSGEEQIWNSKVEYADGVQPHDSKGELYDNPLPSGETDYKFFYIEGIYPIFATTTSINELTKQQLYSMFIDNNIELELVGESGGNRQRFEIPDLWLTKRSLIGIKTYDTNSNLWKYQGQSETKEESLTFWEESSSIKTVQGNDVNYTQYSYDGTERGVVKIRLEFEII